MTDNFLLPAGFQSAGVACGIKDDGITPDLALFYSETDAVSSGVFTQNQVCGAPVVLSRKRVQRSTTRAVVINSGNANACTGERGLKDAEWMTANVAQKIHCHSDDVLVCSTGIIGHFLPREALSKGIPIVCDSLDGSPESFGQAAKAMMTTDKVQKQSTRTIQIADKEIRISGAAKGAAMIAPNMATMLAVIMTDAKLSVEQTDQLLRNSVNQSFNCISVDGHTSTSDTVLLLANGASGAGEMSPENLEQFQHALNEVAEELACSIIRDAEGAGHFVTIDVTGMADDQSAFTIAKSVAEDVLVKTAITGADPNWGRIISASGRTKVKIAEENLSLKINQVSLYESGHPVSYDEKQVSSGMKKNKDVHIELMANLGAGKCRFWTSDLTQEYVRLNSEYTT
jgi:glutamate N-acetyltransferase / amino-acid N-acetyltransferase